MAKELYEGFNGRIICKACAGATARASGMRRDINGAKIYKITDADRQDWLKTIGAPMRCEGCANGG